MFGKCIEAFFLILSFPIVCIYGIGDKLISRMKEGKAKSITKALFYTICWTLLSPILIIFLLGLIFPRFGTFLWNGIRWSRWNWKESK